MSNDWVGPTLGECVVEKHQLSHAVAGFSFAMRADIISDHQVRRGGGDVPRCANHPYQTFKLV
jgi:hypothetical protein